MNNRKRQLTRTIKVLVGVAALAMLYVLIDFSFRQASPPAYQFRVPELQIDKPIILTESNLMVIVARYSSSLVDSLQQGGRLDKISSSFRQQESMVDADGYFVIRGYGSHRGCPLEIVANGFRESCSDAEYDWLGRASKPEQYADLEKIDYYFSQNHSLLSLE